MRPINICPRARKIISAKNEIELIRDDRDKELREETFNEQRILVRACARCKRQGHLNWSPLNTSRGMAAAP